MLALDHGDLIWPWGGIDPTPADHHTWLSLGFRYTFRKATPPTARMVDMVTGVEVAEFLGEGHTQAEVLARRQTSLPTCTDLAIGNDPSQWDRIDVLLVYAYPYQSARIWPLDQLALRYAAWHGKAQFGIVQAFGGAADATGYLLPTPSQLQAQVDLARHYGFDVAAFRWEQNAQDLIRSVWTLASLEERVSNLEAVARAAGWAI